MNKSDVLVASLIVITNCLPGLLFANEKVTTLSAEANPTINDEITVIGLRFPLADPIESPVPITVFSTDDFRYSADRELNDLVRQILPSYNIGATGDASSLVRPASLRGLSSDATLVMVNGKRRHRSAVISFIGGGVSDGAQGPDISVIPAIAIERLEVLRDGGSAQYGSDAIGGILNFVLRNDNQTALSFHTGETYEGDGAYSIFSGYKGLSFANNGFLSMSFEYRQADPTDRAVQKGDAEQLTEAGNTDVPNPAQRWGASEIEDDYKAIFNSQIALQNDINWYGFGNLAKRRVETGFSYRNPNTRSGVFATEQLPGQFDRLVADITSDGVSGNCPQDLDVENQDGLASVIADPDCFVFNELFPGGFTPIFGTDIQDGSIVTGLEGAWDETLTWDANISVGWNEADFFIRDTVSASYGPDTATSFELGSYVQHEKSFNLDFLKSINGDKQHNLAFGIEWREESFRVTEGQDTSWQAGPYSEQGFSIGSNGFTGFSPHITGKWDRANAALYTDYSFVIQQDWQIGLAARFEDYETFGSTFNYRFYTLRPLTNTISARFSHSTGFRAPTPGQENVSNITTVLSDGELIERGTISPINPIAKEFGGEALEPEESQQFNIGLIFQWQDIDLTIDAYQIKMTDRISQSASIELTAQEAQTLEDNGFEGASGLRAFRFFVNDFDTTTKGIDVIASYPFNAFSGDNTLSLNYNFNKTEVDKFDEDTLNELRTRQIEDSLPSHRANLTWRYQRSAWKSMIRLNYYGDYWLAHLNDINLSYEPGSETTVDTYITYSFDFSNPLSITLGANNLFNTFPDRNPYAKVAGSKYPETAPMGTAGGIYFVQLDASL